MHFNRLALVLASLSYAFALPVNRLAARDTSISSLTSTPTSTTSTTTLPSSSSSSSILTPTPDPTSSPSDSSGPGQYVYYIVFGTAFGIILFILVPIFFVLDSKTNRPDRVIPVNDDSDFTSPSSTRLSDLSGRRDSSSHYISGDNNVLSKAELDEMFPAQPFSTFLIDYKRNAEQHKHRRQRLLVSEKQSIRSSEKQVQFARNIVENDPEISIKTIRKDPQEENGKFLCVICQQLIGQEEQDLGVRTRCSDAHADLRSQLPPPYTPFDFWRGYWGNHSPTSDNPSQRRSSLRYTSHCETEELSSIRETETDPEILVRQLSCGHVFHDECIVPWLTERKAICPLCQHVFA